MRIGFVRGISRAELWSAPELRRNFTLRVAMLLALATLASAQDRSLGPGFEHFYNLEYPEALAEFRAESAHQPNDPQPYNHIAQAILYREMFRTGALESEMVTGANAFLRREKLNPSPQNEKEFSDSISRVLSLTDAQLTKNPNDVQALYAKGVAYGLRANYKYLVRKAWMDALHDSSDARKAHSRATELDPKFVDARLVQGVYDYLVGSLPFTWRMLGFLAGFHGDRERGIATLKDVYAHGITNHQDAAIILCAIYRRERRAREAVPFLNELIARFPRNYLLRLELVQMFGDLGEKDKGLAVLAQVAQLKRERAPGYDLVPEEKIHYSRGNLLFWYNDFDAALSELKQVTARAEAIDLNTGSYAWLRLGQTYDLKGQRMDAVTAYRATVRYAPGSDAAHQAEDFLGSRYKRPL